MACSAASGTALVARLHCWRVAHSAVDTCMDSAQRGARRHAMNVPPMSALSPAGPAAQAIADIGWAMFVGAALITALVMGLVWRAVRGPASPVRPWRWIVGAGVLFPSVVLVALMAWSQWRAHALVQAMDRPPPPDALVIGVTGHMWWWEVRLRHPDGGGDIVLANEIRVPVGRTVWLGLSSADVIHSVWLPSLAGKMDTVPGRVNRLVFSVDRPGVHRGVCAEFCGAQHARMALHLVAMEPAAFDDWLRAQARDAKPPETAQQRAGRDAFLAQRCNACHTVRGVASEGRLGPDLTHVGSRIALGAGTLPNDAASMAQWVAHTQDVKPGARMPSYARLDAPTLQALAAWLASLQ
jgi:cytochrome c oxidase subunit 2